MSVICVYKIVMASINVIFQLWALSGKVLIVMLMVGSLFGFLTCGSLNAQNPGYALEMTVSPDGDGDYRSLQEAINATKSFPDDRITIQLKKGVYKEKVRVYSKLLLQVLTE